MSARDTRSRATVLLQSAAMFGCSGSTLDADARAILSARMRTSSSEPGELTSAEWAFAARVTAQAASALDHDRARREVARASGWAYWPPRAPDAPRWPCMAATTATTKRPTTAPAGAGRWVMDNAREILTLAAECATEWTLTETSAERVALLKCEGGGTVALFGSDATGWTAQAGGAERHEVRHARGWKALLQVLEKARHDTPEVLPLLRSAWRAFQVESKARMRRENDAQARGALDAAWPGRGADAGTCEIATLATVGDAGVWLEPLGSGWMCEIHAVGCYYRALPADLLTTGSAQAALADALVQALGDPGLPEEVRAELHAGLARLRAPEPKEASAEGAAEQPGRFGPLGLLGLPPDLNERICPPPQPGFPSDEIQCDRECGFTRAGFGWRCNEGNACGRFINHDEPGCAELTAYYDAAAKADDRSV